MTAVAPSPDTTLIQCVWYGTYDTTGGPTAGKIALGYRGPVRVDAEATHPIGIYPRRLEVTLAPTAITVDDKDGDPVTITVGAAVFWVPASNDPDLEGSGGTYYVEEILENTSAGRTFDAAIDIDAPGGIVYLHTLAGSSPTPGVMYGPPASSVSYDNTDSGLAAGDMQAAVDELAQATAVVNEALEDYTPTAETDAQVAALVDDDSLTRDALDGVYADTAAIPDALRPTAHCLATAPTMVAQACASGHGWVAGSGNVGILTLNDTAYAPIGAQSIKLVTALPTRIDKTGLTLDMTGKQPVVWLMVDDVSKLGECSLYLGGNSLSWYYLFRFTPKLNNEFEFQSGQFVKIVLSFADATTSGSVNRAAITTARFYAEDAAAGAATVHFSGLGTQPEPSTRYPNGCVVFTCDDARVSQWSGMKPTLDKYGYPATAYVIAERVDSGADWLTTQQLQNMQDQSGWEIGAHAYSIAMHDQVGGFTAASDAELEAELVALKRWLLERGLRGSDHLAYPQGRYDADTLTTVRRFFTSARAVWSHPSRASCEASPPGDPYRLRTQTLQSALSLANARARVDLAVANDAVIVFTGHSLGASADAQTWVQSDFDSLVSYVASSGAAVRTVGQMLRGE